jgi:hypothetical protein
VFETTEVFLELAGLKFGGPAGRWAVIVAVQVNNEISSSDSLLTQCCESERIYSGSDFSGRFKSYPVFVEYRYKISYISNAT